MKYFIHTNSKQYLPAQVSRFNALKNRGVEEVTILKVEDYLDLEKLNGKSYLRNGRKIKWFKDDLQSFTLLRFLIPEICKFEGYALLTDPDVFLLKDYSQICSKYNGYDLVSRRIIKPDRNYLESSILIFNNDKFKKFEFHQIIEDLFNFKIDYKELIHLNFFIDQGIKVHEAEEIFNCFDYFDENTEFLHTTNRITQPWKTGLKIDFQKLKDDYYDKNKINPKKKTNLKVYFANKIESFRNKLFKKRYMEHPNKRVTEFFDNLLEQAINSNFISKKELRKEIMLSHVSTKYEKLLQDSY